MVIARISAQLNRSTLNGIVQLQKLDSNFRWVIQLFKLGYCVVFVPHFLLKIKKIKSNFLTLKVGFVVYKEKYFSQKINFCIKTVLF
jgi:hypothetical protein